MTSSSVRGGSWWTPFLTNPVAAGLSIVPAYHGFRMKSMRQVVMPGEVVQKIKYLDSCHKGVKAAPTIGTLVGSQLALQRSCEWLKGGKEPSFLFMLGSSALVAAVTAALASAFNGQTLGKSGGESAKALSWKQTGAITFRDTFFLFGTRMSEPATKWVKQEYGEGKVVETATTFLAGAAGAVAGHPADTALSLLQEKKMVVFDRRLMRGVVPRSLSVASFTVIYENIKKLFSLLLS